MYTEVANKWRGAIQRRFQVLGIELGQAVERLSSAVDTCWFIRFMNGTTDIITRLDMEEIVWALRPIWSGRGQTFDRESLQYFSDEELLTLISIDPKRSED